MDPVPLGKARAAVVLLAALFLRGALILVMDADDPFFTSPRADSILYLERARAIASGRLMNGAVFEQGPLYPYLLAPLVALFPEPFLPVAALQALVDATTAVLAAMLGARLAGAAPAGLAAGLLYATSREPAFFATKVLPVTGTVALVTLGTLLALPSVSRRPRARLATSGAALGLACLLWPGALLTIPALGLWLLAARRRGSLAFLAAAGLSILPATLHNLAYEPRPVLISSHGGITLYQGNNDRARGTYTSLGSGADIREQEAVSRKLAESIAGRPVDRSETSRVLGREARRWMLGNPGKLARLVATKALLTLSGRELPLMYSMAFERRRFVPMLGWMPVTWSLLSILVPACLALSLAVPQRRALLLPTLLAGGALVATLLLVFVDTRYKMPLYPVACAWIAAGAASLRGASAAASTLAVLAAVPGSVLLGTEWRKEPVPLALYTHLCDLAASQGDLPAAYVELELALSFDPAYAPALDRRSALESLATRVPPVLLLGPLAAPELPSAGEAAAAAALLRTAGDEPLARRIGRLALAIGGSEPATRRMASRAMGADRAGPGPQPRDTP